MRNRKQEVAVNHRMQAHPAWAYFAVSNTPHSMVRVGELIK